MSVLKIARMGHPVLSRVADIVEDPTDPAISELVLDMVETMQDAPGVGLAAPQVHVPLRIVVFYLPKGRLEEGESDAEEIADSLNVLINPVIEPLSEEMSDGIEGCLSLPGMAGRVSRHSKIRYTGVGLDGEIIDRVAEGFHARVIQHECDHLDGILYPMRMDDLSTFGYVEEMSKQIPSEYLSEEEREEAESDNEQ